MSMSVAEVLTDKAKQSPTSGATLFTIAPDKGVAEAVALMDEKEISSVLVMEGTTLHGLITLREILEALHTRGGEILQAKCSEVMKADPPTARPGDTVDHLRQLMTELHITHVPVMENDVVVGILSFFDIARSAIKDATFENQLLKQYIRNWPA